MDLNTSTVQVQDQPWRNLKLSLERPYKDSQGKAIPVLSDITPEGEHVYEPKEDPSKRLGERICRVFAELGMDLFDGQAIQRLKDGVSSQPQDDKSGHEPETPAETHKASTSHMMTSEELLKMRMKIVPHLQVAFGEMSHARDLLTLLISSVSPLSGQPPLANDPPSIPSASLSATIVTKPPPIPSVQAFNAQLTIGGKDETLRMAADLFKAAAESMERGHAKSEVYWLNALKIRRGNWALVPAPLPFGSATGKGADKTSKDFLVAFGLEESPASSRRRAVGHMSTQETTLSPLIFPHRQHTRLHVSLRTRNEIGEPKIAHNSFKSWKEDTLEGSLRAAQREVVEHEVFSVLVREAPNLSTASARVSQRLIVIDAAQNMELIFELVDCEGPEEPASEYASSVSSMKCDLIYAALHVLLLHLHQHRKTQRLGTTGVVRTSTASTTPQPQILQPIIDLLQYEVFCARVKAEIDRAVEGLTRVGVPARLRFEPVGGIGEELTKVLDRDPSKKVSGEATLRIDDRYTLRLTLVSPSTLTAHLPQSTLAVPSIPQLCQLLSSEIERCLLSRLCELGSELSKGVKGTWFIDEVKGRSVGRWEGCVLNCKVTCRENFAIQCSVFQLDKDSISATQTQNYTTRNGLPLFEWVTETLTRSLNSS